MAEKTLEEFSLDKFLKEMEKLSGKDSIQIASTAESYTDVIPFSSINLNNATGIGGLPKNKVIEIIGWESAGKTTISTDIIAQCQKTFGDNCFLIDKENSFDPFYASSLSVDLNKLLISRPTSLENCYDVIEKVLGTKKFGVIVVDSLTSFRPQANIEGNAGMGKESRINSDRLRMINEKMVDSNCCIIFINQIREKIGVMFGSPETTSGGNALKFYAHMRIMIRRKEIKDGYNTMHFKFIKNKMAPPMKESTIHIIWGKGFDLEAEAIELAIQSNLLKREGNSYIYKDTKIATSKEKLEQFWKDNPEVLKELTDIVRNTVKETIIIEDSDKFESVDEAIAEQDA
jgi:recombination protein RecA